MTETVNAFWPFGYELHTELGVKFRIGSHRHWERLQGRQRSEALLAISIRRRRPRLETLQPGKEEEWKRNMEKKDGLGAQS